MENNPEMSKLMEQLVKNSRRQLNLTRLQCFFTGAIAVCCLVLLSVVWGVIPQVSELAGQLQELAVQVQNLAAQAQIVLTNLETVTISNSTAATEAATGTVAEFTITKDTGTLSTDVVNQSGATLPETGGIGTTLFYLIGGLMAAGSALTLVIRRRADADEE